MDCSEGLSMGNWDPLGIKRLRPTGKPHILRSLSETREGFTLPNRSPTRSTKIIKSYIYIYIYRYIHRNNETEGPALALGDAAEDGETSKPSIDAMDLARFGEHSFCTPLTFPGISSQATGCIVLGVDSNHSILVNHRSFQKSAFALGFSGFSGKRVVRASLSANKGRGFLKYCGWTTSCTSLDVYRKASFSEK